MTGARACCLTLVVTLLSVCASAQDVPTIDYQMVESWKVVDDGKQPYLFGVLEDLVIDADGTVYVLDTQLENIKVFSPTGHYLRTIGRGGDGPGELRAPGSLVLLPDNCLGVVSKRFGLISKLDKVTGDPLGEIRAEGVERRSVALGRVKQVTDASGGNRLVGVFKEATSDEFLYWRAYLGVFQDHGFGNPSLPDLVVREVGDNKGVALETEEYYALWNPWDVDSRGRIVLAPYWDKYRLEIYGSDGQLEAEADHPIRHRERTAREENRFLDYLCGGIDPNVIGVTLETAKEEAVVREIHTRLNGEIWVRTNMSGYDLPTGTFQAFDVFLGDGTFTYQAHLVGPGDPSLDRVYFGRNNQIVVIHGAEQFIASHYGRDSIPNSYDLVIVSYVLRPMKEE